MHTAAKVVSQQVALKFAVLAQTCNVQISIVCTAWNALCLAATCTIVPCHIMTSDELTLCLLTSLYLPISTATHCPFVLAQQRPYIATLHDLPASPVPACL